MVESSTSLTVVLTTSPSVSNPATELIERVIQSFALVEGLTDCDLIIMCDGVKEIPDDQFDQQKKYRHRKRGWISASRHVLYKQYI